MHMCSTLQGAHLSTSDIDKTERTQATSLLQYHQESHAYCSHWKHKINEAVVKDSVLGLYEVTGDKCHLTRHAPPDQFHWHDQGPYHQANDTSNRIE
jgi:hypothetical protein